MSGPAHCDVCDRTWPESRWTLHDGAVFYWCPVCSDQLEMDVEDEFALEHVSKYVDRVLSVSALPEPEADDVPKI